MQSSSRGGARVRVLAIHTTEGIMRAAALRDWKSWPGSSHASADETGALLGPADGFVPYDKASWTLRSGNPWSDNIEICGWARWSRQEWLARPALLEAVARWLAERSRARGIPLRKLTPAQYRAGESGVIGHVDHTVGYADGTHTDPGKGFPYDVVLARAQAIAAGPGAPLGGLATTIEEDDMTPGQAAQLNELLARVQALTGPTPAPGVFTAEPLVDYFWRKPLPEDHGVPILHLRNASLGVSALLSRPGADVDERSLAAALAPLLPAVAPAVVDQLSDADVQRLAEAVADVQARRLAS